MRITLTTPRYYNTTQINFAQKKKEEERKDDYTSSHNFLKAWAAGSIAALAMAYGGGQIILSQYEKRVNEILDKYEQELKILEKQTDSINNEIDKILYINENSEEV